MIMDGCQGKPRTPTIEEKICPNCGSTIEVFSTDTEVACENCGFVAKTSLYRDMMSGIRFVTNQKNINRMDKTKPVYFMSGDEDPVGDYGKGVERAYKAFCKAGLHDVMIRLYPGGRHEMLNETNRLDVQRDILNWINEKLEVIAANKAK